MKNLITILIITTSFVIAQIPQTVSFQGYLSDSNGEPISDGNYEVTFRLFDSMTEGNNVWEENHSMEITGSLISANLGSFNPIILPETGIPFLEIQIGDEILTPRQEITSSFFAFKSSESDTASFAKTIPLYFTLQLDSLSTITDSLFNLVLEEPDTAYIITYDTTFVFDSTFVFSFDTTIIYDTLNIFTYDTTVIYDTLSIFTYDTTTIYDSTFIFTYDTTTVFDTTNIFTYDTTVVYDTTYISVDSSAYATYADTANFTKNLLTGSWDNSDNGYIRIGNMQFMWGINTSFQSSITFSPTFYQTPSVVITPISSTAANNIDLSTVTTSSASVNMTSATSGYHWLAIGRWQ
jgi:hypothetical protein